MFAITVTKLGRRYRFVKKYLAGSVTARNSLAAVGTRFASWTEMAAQLKPLIKRGQQKVIASRLDLSDESLSRYLSGERTPDPALALRIIEASGVDLAAFLGLTEASAAVRDLEAERLLDRMGALIDQFRGERGAPSRGAPPDESTTARAGSRR